MARTVQKKVAPNFGDAHQDLQTVAEAAVLINSLLDDVAELPFLSAKGFDTSRLQDLNAKLAQVGPGAWELSRLLGDGEPDTEVDEQMARIERTLNTLQEGIRDYQTEAKQIRQRATDVKTKTLHWIDVTPILASIASFWIALSQLCVLARAWSTLRPSA
jgi:hypothetical protein